jgi:DNA adenine methylase
MILRRLGRKDRIADKIYKYFPKHQNYIEPFFGAGGMFFNKPKAKYNFLNDLDSNVVNLFNIVLKQPNEFKKFLELIPIHDDIWNNFKNSEPTNEFEKALQFWYLSNLGFLGKPNSLRLACRTTKKYSISIFEEMLIHFHKTNCQFLNTDFRNVLKRISLLSSSNDWFIYSDPPYFQTEKYETEWTEKDVIDCFDVTFNSGVNGAMSEFDNEFIIQQAKERKLNIIYIGERQNLKNRRTEILITNYQVAKSLFDDCN